jgi:glycerol-3-phosphate cytidylyltransferase
MKKKIAYTTGVFDLFHIGHLNILKKAKEYCDELIVGVTIDELVYKRKNKYPVIPFCERKEIINAVRYVDKVVSQDDMDKMKAFNLYNFDLIIVGSDWKGTDKWNNIELEMKKNNVEVIYIPYTVHTSSTLINSKLKKL